MDPSKVTPKSPVVPLLPAAPPLHNLEAVLNIDHLTAPVGGIPSSAKTDLHEHPEAMVGNVDCPTCGEDMKVLAAEVPMSHHVNSTIVCRISGAVMDSQNEPMSFPNGYVYSSKVSSLRPRSIQHCGILPSEPNRTDLLGTRRDGKE
jgi:macrophage erythroblast attacher